MTQKLGFSPWFSMWASPQKTIRAIVNSNPSHHRFLLSLIVGFPFSFFSLLHYLYIPGHILFASLQIFVLSLIIAPICGYIWVNVMGFLLYLGGTILSGQSSAKHLRAAIRWSHLPFVAIIIMWFVLITFSFGQFALYLKGESRVMISIIEGVIVLWSVVLFVQSIIELQGFSILRAITNILISWLLFFVLLCVIFFLTAGAHFIYQKIIEMM